MPPGSVAAPRSSDVKCVPFLPDFRHRAATTGTVTLQRRISFATWVVLLAGFLFFGARAEMNKFNSRSPFSMGPLPGIDDELQPFTGIDHFSREIVEVSKKIPEDSPVMVVGPGDDFSFSQIYMSLGYLLWPRQVWELGRVQPGKTPKFMLMPPNGVQPHAIFLYQFNIPPEYRGREQQVGPRIHVMWTGNTPP